MGLALQAGDNISERKRGPGGARRRGRNAAFLLRTRVGDRMKLVPSWLLFGEGHTENENDG